MRADTAPDVQGWAAQGLLTDLTPMISAADKADFVQAAFKGAQYNGKAYAVPQTVDALALFYNKALFKAAGLTTPPATLAQLDAVLPEVRRRQGHRASRRLLLDPALDLGHTAAASSTWTRSRS